MVTACAHCHRRFVVGDDTVGRAARCRYCNERFLIMSHDLETIGLTQDDDDIGRALQVPTLDDIEDCVLPPDVGQAPAASAMRHLPAPYIGPRGGPEYLEGHQSVSLLLLLAWVIVILVYGLSAASAWPPAIAEASANGIHVAADPWVRVWKPLLARCFMTITLAGGLFWLGAYVASRTLCVRYRTSGLLESLAIVSVTMTLPMLVSMITGSDDARITIPATVAAFPVVCLLVPVLFGMPLATGLTTAAICVGIAVPGYLATVLWTGTLQEQLVAADDQRIARSIEHKKREAHDQPLAASRSTPVEAAVAVAMAMTHDSTEPTKAATAPAVLPQVAMVGGVPQVPPPVVMTSEATASPPALQAPPAAPAAPASPPAVEETASVAAPPAAPARSALRVWREAGTPQQIVAPALPGPTFATVKLDGFGNHVIEAWAAEPLQRRGTLRLGDAPRATYAICPDGESLLRVVNGASPVAEVWSLADGSRRLQVPLPGPSDSRALGFFDRLSAGILMRNAADVSVDVLDIRRGVVKKTLQWTVGAQTTTELTPDNVVITPDGKAIAFVDSAMHLRLMDVATGTTRKQWTLNLPREHGPDVTAISFSSDGMMVAVLFDESQSAGKSSLFLGFVVDLELAAINFAEPVWRQAGCPRVPGRRVGHVMDWLDPHYLLLYGELVVDAATGVVVASTHPRDANKPPGPAANSQFRLPDGTFLLEPVPDPQGKRLPIQRLRTDMLAN